MGNRRSYLLAIKRMLDPLLLGTSYAMPRTHQGYFLGL